MYILFNKAKLNPGRSNGLGFVKEPINTFVLIFPKCQSDIIFKENSSLKKRNLIFDVAII